jgi:16S rRNA processing protein RimM
VLRVEGVETREAAEALVGADVYADRDALAPLDEGSFYVEDIIGYEVREEGAGAVAAEDAGLVGAVAGVIDNPAHDILRIAPKGGGKELLLPMVDEFVLAVDGATRTVTVRLPDGLADV